MRRAGRGGREGAGRGGREGRERRRRLLVGCGCGQGGECGQSTYATGNLGVGHQEHIDGLLLEHLGVHAVLAVEELEDVPRRVAHRGVVAADQVLHGLRGLNPARETRSVPGTGHALRAPRCLSRTLTSRRWMYPVSDVFTAVSMSPSRPPMAWKKNSCGRRPRRYEFSTKPRDSGW